MQHGAQGLFLPLMFLFVATTSFPNVQPRQTDERGLKSAVFTSPEFVMEPGSVSDKIYYNIDFPKGHIAIKSFNAEVIDENGNSVPLRDTYLHHWAVLRYYQRHGMQVSDHKDVFGFLKSDFIVVKNAGICGFELPQFFGLGSETRQTATDVPDPYGIEVGNPTGIPSGYEERWLLNVHAIDTRGTEDSLGCTECRCDLYNVTSDEYGRKLSPNYIGGLRCCYDGMRCRLRKGFHIDQIHRSRLFVRYTVKWVDWDTVVLPVKIYIFDVTDKWKKIDPSTGISTKHDCQIEYDIEPFVMGADSNDWVDSKRVALSLQAGGDVIYGAAHQHTGGIGSTLYREDGRVICSSMPIYGDGQEAGNEEGYIVGMSTCYPTPGSVKISDGETLILESNYSRTQGHTGVMGLFYLLIAEPSTESNSFLRAPIQGKQTKQHFIWGDVFFGVSIAAAVIAAYKRKSQREDEYVSIAV
jgi:hypothetical protein